jgi:CheY-like chemotaxis protein
MTPIARETSLLVNSSVGPRNRNGFLHGVIAKGRSGREAIALAHEWVPDLILMDVRMPR